MLTNQFCSPNEFGCTSQLTIVCLKLVKYYVFCFNFTVRDIHVNRMLLYFCNAYILIN